MEQQHQNKPPVSALTKAILDKFPNLEDLLKLPSLQTHLHSLTCLPLAECQKELQKLDEDEKRLDRKLAELSFQESRSFIHCQEAYTQVGTIFDEISVVLEKMAQFTPLLEENVKTVSTSFPPKSKNSKDNPKFNFFQDEEQKLNILNANYQQLSQILSIPRLLDSLVDTDSFDDAMDLKDHAEHLSLRFKQIKIIDTLILEPVRYTMERMVTKLLYLLKEDLSLASMVKIMGHLRRLNIFTEYELATYFLVHRRELLDRSIVMSSSISIYIESIRNQMNEIISEFQAIFTEPSCVPLLSSFILFYLDIFLVTIEQKMNDEKVVNYADILSICNQLMHFGVVLGRKGFDFRFQLVEMFERKLDLSNTKHQR